MTGGAERAARWLASPGGWTAAAVVALLLATCPAHAQRYRYRREPFAPLRLTRIWGRVELGVRGERERRARPNQGTSWYSEELEFDELVRLDLNGYSYHPRFLRFHVGLETQALERPINRGSDVFLVGGGTRLFFGGDWRFTFLERHPYNLSLFGNSSERDVERSFARTFRERSLVYGATSHIRKGPIPLTLSYQRWSRKRRDPALTITEEGDDALVRGRYDIGPRSRGSLEYRYRTDDITERGLELTRHEVLATNTTALAGNRRRRFYGSVRLYQQENNRTTPAAAGPLFRTREAFVFGNLNWQHTRNVSTFYHSDLQFTDTGGQSATVWNGSASISHQLYESLTSTAEIYSSIEDGDFGFTGFYGGRLTETYVKKLGSWGRLSVNLAAFGELRDRNPKAEVGQVFDEAITLSNAPVALSKPDVVADSIVVTDLSGGIVYEEGTDYVVLVTGRITQIQRLATGAIADGETVLVDYQFEVVPESNVLASGLNQNTSISIGDFFTIYFRSTNNGQQLLAGTPEVRLESYDGYAVGARSTWWWTTTTVEYETVRSSFVNYHSIYDTFTIAMPSSFRLRGHAGVSYRFQDFTDSGETVERITGIWGAMARFWDLGVATLDGEYQRERWTGRTTDNDLDGFGIHARVTYPYRDLEFELDGRVSRITQRGEDEDRDRLVLRVRRRF